MRFRELFESQYQDDAFVDISKEISKINQVLTNFDALVNAKGWNFAEAQAKQLLQDQIYDHTLVWMLTTPKLKASYEKLQSVRKALEDKINSGV